MGASILGGLFETVLGAFLKPLRRFFPAVVTGTVVLSIGLSLISVGVGSFGGGTSANDYGSLENLLIGLAVMVIVLAFKHGAKGLASSSCILIGIICGYVICAILPCSCPPPASPPRCGVHQGLGAQLGQGGSGQLVLHSRADARQARV